MAGHRDDSRCGGRDARSINPLLIAIVDIPLFVIGSALAALNFRWAVWIATAWTVLVALGMVIYATATTEAGLGAVLMVLAALGSLLAGMLMIVGRIPSEKLLVGPFAFHSSHTRIRSRLLMHTTIQIVVFWGVFLIIIPVIINSFEDRWNLAYKFPILLIVVGFALLAVSSVIGVWSARAIANFGSGTPLPSQMAHHLVARGPYAFVATRWPSPASSRGWRWACSSVRGSSSCTHSSAHCCGIGSSAPTRRPT